MEVLPLNFQFGLLLLCLLLSSFFSSSEAAFLSLQRVRLRHMVNTNVPGATQVSELASRPERLLSTVLLGNNLTNTAAAALGTAIAIELMENPDQAVLVSTLGVTILLLIVGEIVPKTLATTHPERMAFLYWRPLRWLEIALTPGGAALQAMSRMVRRIAGNRESASPVSEEEIRMLISVGRETGAVENVEAELLEKVFKFGDRQVREVMTPRTEIVAVERHATLRDFLDAYVRHTHTRFPVFEEDLDNVVGLLSVKDVVRGLAQGDLQYGDDVTGLVRAVYFVPETKLVASLVNELREAGHQMAMVIDEYGGIAGLVTLKRLVEEVMGRGGEEGAPVEEEVQEIAQDTFKVDAGIRVDEANERLGLNIPPGDYETLAGFVLSVLGHIPEPGERITYGGFHLAVTEVSGVRISEITVTVERPGAGEEKL